MGALLKRVDATEQQDRMFLFEWVMQCLLSLIVSAANIFERIRNRQIQDRKILIGSLEYWLQALSRRRPKPSSYDLLTTAHF